MSPLFLQLVVARHVGDPSNSLNDAPLEKINWNAAVLLWNAYHRQPSVSFLELLVNKNIVNKTG